MKYKISSVPIAFFDLDDTLIDFDTNSLWLNWRIKEKKCPTATFELLIGLSNYYNYKKGKLTDKKINRFYKARTIFMNSKNYKRRAVNFFNEIGKDHLYEESKQLIDAHLKKGIHVVLITAQDDYIATLFAEYLKMDGCISNVKIVKNNRFKGMSEPNCYGKGKLELAAEYSKNLGIPLSDCSFYTDSISDMPLLDKIKYPVAVNPDKELLSIADKSKWQVYTFEM